MKRDNRKHVLSGIENLESRELFAADMSFGLDAVEPNGETPGVYAKHGGGEECRTRGLGLLGIGGLAAGIAAPSPDAVDDVFADDNNVDGRGESLDDTKPLEKSKHDTRMGPIRNIRVQ